MVRTNTAVLPGADAAVVRIKETRRALAMCLDGNGRYCAVSPREGARLVVAEAARNVVCVGARPLAITNCLNFASPERPEVMWSFSEVIDGMAEACRAFDTPVISGNVSFYNETEGRGIHPTPVIGMVGLIEDVRRVIQQGFKAAGHTIALLGETGDDLSVSEYAATIEGRTVEEMIGAGRVPQLDLGRERAVQSVVLRAAEAGLLHSAHDCSDGGLAVALAESSFSRSTARRSEPRSIFLQRAALFLRQWSFQREAVAHHHQLDNAALAQIESLADDAGCPLPCSRQTTDDQQLRMPRRRDGYLVGVSEAEAAWRAAHRRETEGRSARGGGRIKQGKSEVARDDSATPRTQAPAARASPTPGQLLDALLSLDPARHVSIRSGGARDPRRAFSHRGLRPFEVVEAYGDELHIKSRPAS